MAFATHRPGSSPARYAAALLLVSSVLYAAIHTVPVTRADLSLLHAVSNAGMAGTSPVGQAAAQVGQLSAALSLLEARSRGGDAVHVADPALLELEITEGMFIRDLNLAILRIRELQRLGISIALDDFGTGYSSLSYLQRMPIDAVKLDRSLVSELTSNAATVSMVRSVLAMAGALNLRVVTEGVETAEQLEILRDLGCAEAQGFLLGRPESADMALVRGARNTAVCDRHGGVGKIDTLQASAVYD